MEDKELRPSTPESKSGLKKLFLEYWRTVLLWLGGTGVTLAFEKGFFADWVSNEVVFGMLCAVVPLLIWDGVAKLMAHCRIIREHKRITVSIAIVVMCAMWCWLWRFTHPPDPPAPPPSYENRFSRELDGPVERAFLVIDLFETNVFSVLCPLDVALSVYKDKQGFLFRAEGMTNQTRGPGWKFMVSSYRLSTSPLPENGTNLFKQIYVPAQAGLKQIRVPVALWSVEPKPFPKLRDFHNANLLVRLSPSLTSKVERVQFIVNGWALFQTAVNATNQWRLNVVRGAPFRPEVELYTLLRRAPGDRPPAAAWLIDVYEKPPEFFTNGSGAVSILDKSLYHVPGRERITIRPVK